jgi:hypothetical protein
MRANSISNVFRDVAALLERAVGQVDAIQAMSEEVLSSQHGALAIALYRKTLDEIESEVATLVDSGQLPTDWPSIVDTKKNLAHWRDEIRKLENQIERYSAAVKNAEALRKLTQ